MTRSQARRTVVALCAWWVTAGAALLVAMVSPWLVLATAPVLVLSFAVVWPWSWSHRRERRRYRALAAGTGWPSRLTLAVMVASFTSWIVMWCLWAGFQR